MRKIIFGCIAFITIQLSYCQLIVSGENLNPQQLAEELAGENILVFNASLTGASDQSGTFDFTGEGLGINSGLLLTSGSLVNAVGPNSSGSTSRNNGGGGSAELNLLSGKTTLDAVMLQFDFEVQSTGISFNYIFASEEYNEWVGSNFNDVFGFFISGPGITGDENIAVVPGTTDAITINNINNNSYWQFYNDNIGGGANIQFDGYTTVMTAQKNGLIPCNVYTLKLIVADASDRIYDTGVFLEKNSLVQELVSATANTVTLDDTALEGCFDASFTFNLDNPQTDDTYISYLIGGTAINGVDYKKIDNAIIIPAGQTSATIIIDALADGIPEAQETIELSYESKPCDPLETVTLYIDDNQPIEFTLSGVDLTCNGDNSGQITADIIGGIAPYNITLNGTDIYNSLPITGLAAGTYEVKVDDFYGCGGEAQVIGAEFDAGTTFLPDGQGNVYTTSVNISGFEPSATLVTAEQLQSLCLTLEHSFMGDIEIKLIAPNGSEIILKERPGGNNVNFGEPVANGPVDTNSNDLTPGIGYEYCFNNTPVFGTMVDESNNNHTYNYVDNSGNVHNNEKHLPSGAYQPYQSFDGLIGSPLNGDWTIYVRDYKPNDNGYIFNWSISFTSDLPGDIIIINEPDKIEIISGITKAACGTADGSVDITVNGDFPPFNYNWSNGETTEDISGLAAGAYTITITDQNGCSQDSTFLVSNAGALTVNGVITNASCNGISDGAIDITPDGGSGNYIYSWSNGETTQDVSGLIPATYTVTVTDNTVGCIALGSFIVNQPAPLSITASVTNEKCADREGIIAVTVSGGDENYIYDWDNGETTATIQDLESGVYTVIVTDGNNCSMTDTFTVINEVGDCIPDCDLTITSSILNDENCGQSDGSINLAISTKYGPYSVTWSNGETTDGIVGLSAGTYTVTIQDNEGCEVSGSYDIQNQTGTLSTDIPFINNEQCGNGAGAIDITVLGGSPAYAFVWSNGENTEDINNLSAGSYSVTITDQTGCSLVESYTISNESGTLTQTYGNAVDEVCGNSRGSIDITISGGTVPYTYLWSNGADTQDLKYIPAGAYSCVITDQTGCAISTPVYTVNDQAGTLEIDFIDIDNEVCGNGSGAIELHILGGTAPYTYTWSNGVTGTNSISGLSAGTYSCLVTDQEGCSVDTGILTIIDDAGSMTIDNIYTQHEQCGNGSGAIELDVSGGNGVYTYAWSNGATTSNISGLSSGIYSCTITDENGCSLNTSVSVNNTPGTLAIENIVPIDNDCGDGTGAIDITISGGTIPYTFAWSNGSTTEDINGLIPGEYICTITDANGCVLTSSTVISGSAITIENINIAHETCSTGNGTIGINVSGGSGIYTYAWSTGAATADVSGLTAGIYSCVITDELGCSVTSPDISVNGNTGGLVVDNNTSIDNVCHYGLIDLTITGGTAPYNFLWSNGETTEDLTVTTSGTYTCTISDTNGYCTTNSSTVTITGDPLSATVSSINDDCGTGDGGIIYQNVYGGTTPYTYAWSNGATTEDITGLSSGTYTCTITDAIGCTYTTTTIIETGLPFEEILVTDDICGTGEGSIEVNVSGATGSFHYWLYKDDWTYVGSGSSISGLEPGVYFYYAIATDWTCEAYSDDIIISGSPTLAVNSIIVDDNCGNEEGSLDITVSGGTPPYSLIWSNGEIVEDITGLAAGDYTCSITDANGCTLDSTFTVSGATLLLVDNMLTINDNCGAGAGAIDITISGGTEPYDYLWSTGETTEDIAGLVAGSYTCTITDANGCTLETTATITDQAISIDGITTVDDNCGAGIGSIDLTISGANAPFIYLWSNGETTEDITGLDAGTYTCTITDNAGCTIEPAIEIADISTTVDNIATVDDMCGAGIGSINLSITGDCGPYTYLWSNGETTEDITGLVADTYTCTITNANGWSFTSSTDVQDLGGTAMYVDVTTNEDNDCGKNGSITQEVFGGTSPHTYLWSNGETTKDLTNVIPGTYTCDITDANGCTITTTTTLGGVDPIVFENIIIIDDECETGEGSIEVSVSGGSSPYDFWWWDGSWTNTTTNSIISNLEPGTYRCWVFNSSGSCFAYDDIVVSGPAESLNVSNAIAVDDHCGADEGSIDITVSGGTAPYTFTWSNGAMTEDLSNLTAGAYTCTITDANGCTIESTTTITGAAVAIDNAITVNDDCGDGSGSIDLVVSAGTAPFTYNWSNGATSEDINSLSPGAYTCTVTDVNGCTDVLTVNITGVVATLAVDEIITTNDDCGYGQGSINIIVSGGTIPYTYLWSNGAVTKNISGLVTGSYTCIITDVNGCTLESTSDISSTSAILLDYIFITDEICSDGMGSVDISVSGGSGDYSYLWNNSSKEQDIQNLTADLYTCTISDNENGCQLEISAQVNNNGSNHTITNSEIFPDVCQGNTGRIDITVDGGALPYTYLWSNGANTEDISGLQGNIDYSVEVYDANNCLYEQTFTVPKEDIGFTIIDVQVIDEQCASGSGSIDLTVTGDGGPFAYSWSNGATTQDINNLSSGTYTCTITDIYGCIAESTTEIAEIPILAIEEVIIANDNCEEDSGAIDITVSGGATPYTYLWSNGAVTEDITGLNAGIYTILVKDSKNCSLEAIYEVENYIPFSISDALITNSSCATCADGAINLIIDTNPNNLDSINYFWSNGSQTQDIDNLLPADYSLDITYNSENGTCMDSFSLTIGNDNLEIDNGSFSIYPNPSNGLLFIENKNAIIIDAIIISNSLGVEVFNEKLNNQNEINYSMNLDFLSKGVYTMTIISGSTTINYKLLRN